MPRVTIMKYATLVKKFVESSNIKVMVYVRSSENLNEIIDRVLDIDASETDKLQLIEDGTIQFLQTAEQTNFPLIVNEDQFHQNTLCKVKAFPQAVFFQVHHKELINGVY